MKREPGYYWTRQLLEIEFHISYWNGERWEIHGYEGKLDNHNFVEIGEKVERSRWIPVSERLPDFGQRVLLYHFPRYPKAEEAVISIDYRREHKRLKGLEKERLFISMGFSFCEPIAWMPLPEPPKQ